MYLNLKQTHVILVICSVVFFQFRYWYYRVNRRTPHKIIKIMPHLIDTLLFASGISLAVMAGFSPQNSAWLLFKLIALLAYIIFGMLAMKKSGTTQWLGYIVATTAVIYMIFAATQKIPWPH